VSLDRQKQSYQGRAGQGGRGPAYCEFGRILEELRQKPEGGGRK
jgi:hypothetical protein